MWSPKNLCATFFLFEKNTCGPQLRCANSCFIKKPVALQKPVCNFLLHQNKLWSPETCVQVFASHKNSLLWIPAGMKITQKAPAQTANEIAPILFNEKNCCFIIYLLQVNYVAISFELFTFPCKAYPALMKNVIVFVDLNCFFFSVRHISYFVCV